MLALVPRLFAAAWLPRFHWQAVLRLHPTVSPWTAVIDGEAQTATKKTEGRILHASVAAEALGIHAGMTCSQALARESRLLLMHRSPEAEAQAQHDLVQTALSCTPDVESTAAGLCLLELSRVREAATQRERIGQRLHESLAAQQLEARIGFATNPDLAFLAAQAADPVLIVDDDGHDFLQSLPILALRPAPALAQLLHLWGIRTLGQFVQLPRQDIAARLGREGVLLWDMAAGGRDRLLRWLRPVTSYREEIELEHALESVEPLLFVLKSQLDSLCARLRDDWLVAAAMLLELGFDNGESHARELRVAEPTRDADLLLRVLQSHLEGRTTSAPVMRVVLELRPARAVANQSQLFERTLRDPNRFAETLAQLESFLGAGNVGRVNLLPSRRPDAFEVVNFLQSTATADHAESTPCTLPLRCYRPPKEARVQVQQGRPSLVQVGAQTLRVLQASGPWLVSGDWWDTRAWQREVWEIAAHDGGLYQLAHEHDRWRMEGMFG